MRWLRSLGIAFLTALAGGTLASIVGDWATRFHHMSDMEGGRGMFLAFFLAPLGFIASGIVSLIVTRFRPRRGWRTFGVDLGVSLLTIGVIALISAGVSWTTAPHPPKIDGHNLVLDFELRLPGSHTFSAQATTDDAGVSLYTNGKDNHYATLRFGEVTSRDGQTIFPGSAYLYTSTFQRGVLARFGTESEQVMHLKLHAIPRKEDMRWSDWIPAKERADLSAVPAAEAYAIRYRVQLAPPES